MFWNESPSESSTRLSTCLFVLFSPGTDVISTGTISKSTSRKQRSAPGNKNLLSSTNVPPPQGKHGNEARYGDSVVHRFPIDRPRKWKEKDHRDETSPDDGDVVDGFLPSTECEWPFLNGHFFLIVHACCNHGNVREIHCWSGHSKDTVDGLHASQGYEVQQRTENNHQPDAVKGGFRPGIDLPENTMMMAVVNFYYASDNVPARHT